MSRMRIPTLSLVAALAAVLAVSPASAQGRWDRNRDRDERHEYKEARKDRRERDREYRREREERERAYRREQAERERAYRREMEARRREQERARRRYEDRYGRYDDRYGRSGSYGSYGGYDRSGSYGSYNEAHRAFHRDHDRYCRERASLHPYDPTWQLRVRSECATEHNRWHERAGIRHDGRAISSRW